MKVAIRVIPLDIESGQIVIGGRSLLGEPIVLKGKNVSFTAPGACLKIVVLADYDDEGNLIPESVENRLMVDALLIPEDGAILETQGREGAFDHLMNDEGRIEL